MTYESTVTVDASEGFSPSNLRLLALEVLAVPSMPDDTLTVLQMKQYGYYFGGMLPLSRAVAEQLYEQNCCIYRLYDDDTEGMVEDPQDFEAHATEGGIFGIEKADWLNYLNREFPPANISAEEVCVCG